MKRFLLCLVMVLCGCLCVANAQAESLIVGLMKSDRPPYFWKNATGGYQGLFIDVLNELTKETDIYFSYKALPQARLRLHLVAGKIDAEMGVAKEWRTGKAEVEHSVYSIPFMQSDSVYVMHSGANDVDPKTKVPVGNNFCAILGFSMPKALGKTYINVLSEEQLLKMIDKRRCDYTIMQSNIFSNLMKRTPYNLIASKPVFTNDIRLRLNKKNEYLLLRINAGLNRLKEDGRLAAILSRYE